MLPGSNHQWVQGLRESAIKRFAENGFPSRRDEEWKYTDLTGMSEQTFQPVVTPGTGSDGQPTEKSQIDHDNAIIIAFENGRWLFTEAGLDLPPPGVTITSLGKMLSDFPDRIKQHLALFTNPADHSLVSLNTAFSHEGAFVHIEKGVVLDRPIRLQYRSTSQDQPHLSLPRNLIVLEEGAEAVVVETYASENPFAAYWNNIHTEVALGQNARLEHIQVQDESLAAYHTTFTNVQQARDSRYVSHVYALGGLLARSDLDVSLEDSGAECELNGLTLTSGNQHIDHHTRIDHIEPDCSSRELYKGILADSSRGVFNGKIYVHPDAQRTAAFQSNPNLLLSRKAEIDTKPQLEIFADDVKCSHGATIGQLDQEALFFLRSRGIDELNARNILISAFAQEIVKKVSHSELQEELSELVSHSLLKLTGSHEVN